MANLVDTNVLVYCFDPRFPGKQAIACEVVRQGLANRQLVLPHQAIVEFVAATTRPRSDLDGASLLAPQVAYREAITKKIEEVTLCMRKFLLQPIFYNHSNATINTYENRKFEGMAQKSDFDLYKRLQQA